MHDELSIFLLYQEDDNMTNLYDNNEEIFNNAESMDKDNIPELSQKLSKLTAKKKKLKRRLKEESYLYDSDRKRLKRKYKKVKAKALKAKKQYEKACSKKDEQITYLNNELHRNQNEINKLLSERNDIKLNYFALQCVNRDLIRELAYGHPNYEKIRNQEIENLYKGTCLSAPSIDMLLNEDIIPIQKG